MNLYFNDLELTLSSVEMEDLPRIGETLTFAEFTRIQDHEVHGTYKVSNVNYNLVPGKTRPNESFPNTFHQRGLAPTVYLDGYDGRSKE